MTFARAPVQPVSGFFGKLQATGEGFDLLPFTPGHVDIQSSGCRLSRMNGKVAYSAEGNGPRGQS